MMVMPSSVLGWIALAICLAPIVAIVIEINLDHWRWERECKERDRLERLERGMRWDLRLVDLAAQGPIPADVMAYVYGEAARISESADEPSCRESFAG
jgi:hypothetical protein